jgi:hypothetical protein
MVEYYQMDWGVQNYQSTGESHLHHILRPCQSSSPVTPGAPFLNEWAKIQNDKEKSANSQPKRKTDTPGTHENLDKYKYLSPSKMSTDEINVRSMIFDEDPNRHNPPILKIDLTYIVNKMATEAKLGALDVELLLDRLGVKSEPDDSFYPTNSRIDNDDIIDRIVLVFSPPTYKEIGSRWLLSPATTSKKVKQAMHALNQELILYCIA